MLGSANRQDSLLIKNKAGTSSASYEKAAGLAKRQPIACSDIVFQKRK